ncbi:MAG: hypothetical protein ABIZ80_22490 [Bryobacteraceae bacterium]
MKAVIMHPGPAGVERNSAEQLSTIARQRNEPVHIQRAGFAAASIVLTAGDRTIVRFAPEYVSGNQP